MLPRGDWKSAAADKLQRIGRGNSAKALYGVDNQKGRPPGELRASQLREERQAPCSHAQAQP